MRGHSSCDHLITSGRAAVAENVTPALMAGKKDAILTDIYILVNCYFNAILLGNGNTCYK